MHLKNSLEGSKHQGWRGYRSNVCVSGSNVSAELDSVKCRHVQTLLWNKSISMVFFTLPVIVLWFEDVKAEGKRYIMTAGSSWEEGVGGGACHCSRWRGRKKKSLSGEEEKLLLKGTGEERSVFFLYEKNVYCFSEDYSILELRNYKKKNIYIFFCKNCYWGQLFVSII